MITGEPLIKLNQLIDRYPALAVCRPDLEAAYETLRLSYSGGGKLLVCGNGGSASDSAHIAGELLKGFLKKRPLEEKMCHIIDAVAGEPFAHRLQQGLSAICLCDQGALISAVANDLGGDLAYAQQVIAYGKPEDVLIGISTSGNADNIRKAVCAAKALNMKTIALTGRTGGWLGANCDIAIKVPADKTPDIQEYHLPVYHALCAMLEAYFFTA